MKIFYRDLTKQDLKQWVALAKSEFSISDFCDENYLLKGWDHLRGYVLQNNNNEWMGVVWLDFEGNGKYNPDGCHILEVVLFPKYRNSTFIKYLGKIIFDNAHGLKKSASVRPGNKAPTYIMQRLGFKITGREWYFFGFWNNYICDADFYPKELKNITLKYKKLTLDF
ncbi:MAG TPA: hypothetical protein PLZ05_01040 [Alphaproteobacteria bacterium]|nr:hypothetical protein [Alphaproteobacteria bacterium]